MLDFILSGLLLYRRKWKLVCDLYLAFGRGLEEVVGEL